MALKQFNLKPGEGICTDMRAVRKDYFLDHGHSAYVDQWYWEKVITKRERNLKYLTKTREKTQLVRPASDHLWNALEKPANT